MHLIHVQIISFGTAGYRMGRQGASPRGDLGVLLEGPKLAAQTATPAVATFFLAVSVAKLRVEQDSLLQCLLKTIHLSAQICVAHSRKMCFSIVRIRFSGKSATFVEDNAY